MKTYLEKSAVPALRASHIQAFVGQASWRHPIRTIRDFMNLLLDLHYLRNVEKYT